MLEQFKGFEVVAERASRPNDFRDVAGSFVQFGEQIRQPVGATGEVMRADDQFLLTDVGSAESSNRFQFEVHVLAGPERFRFVQQRNAILVR